MISPSGGFLCPQIKSKCVPWRCWRNGVLGRVLFVRGFQEPFQEGSGEPRVQNRAMSGSTGEPCGGQYIATPRERAFGAHPQRKIPTAWGLNSQFLVDMPSCVSLQQSRHSSKPTWKWRTESRRTTILLLYSITYTCIHTYICT